MTKKEKIFVVFNPLTYFKESYTEFQKVVWPTRMETIRLSLVVILVSIIVGIYISGLDYMLTKITETFIK